MNTYIIVFFALGVLSYIYLKIAERFRIVDKPNYRSSHTQLTIRGGGIIFYFALTIFFFLHSFSPLYVFIGATLIGGLSFIDDIKPLSPILRFPIQILAIILVFYQVQFSISWIYYPIWIVLGVGVLNAINFMDGINGITGMYGIVFFSTVLYINEFHLQFINSDLLIFFLLALFIFGFYNFRKKALFFAGDVGSITLAICMIFIVLKLYIFSGSFLTVLFISIYGIDTFLTILRRVFMREKLTEAHRHHLYQHFVDNKKFTHLQTSLIYAILQTLVNVIVLIAWFHSSFEVQVFIFFLIITTLSTIYFLTLSYLITK